MSDERLRELERAWRRTRSAKDEAAWLRARVRVGDLPQERVALAAYCGHPAASLALPPEDAPRPAPWWQRLIPGREAAEWARGLPGLDAAVKAQVCLSLLLEVLPRFEARYPGPGHREPHEALLAAAQQLDCPCATHEEAALDAMAECDLISLTQGYDEPLGDVTNLLASAACGALLPGAGESVADEIKAALGLFAWPRAREIVSQTLVSWALGYGDPVRTRVAQRGEVVNVPEEGTIERTPEDLEA